MRRCLSGAAGAGAVTLLVWALWNTWPLVTGDLADPEHQFPLITKISNIFELGPPALFFAGFVAWMVGEGGEAWRPLLVCGCLLGVLVVILPFTLRARSPSASAAEIESFSDWIRAIPPTSTVYIPSFKDNGHFAWLTLGRPNYLSTNQSAGVVFSRPLAMEVARRSTVLLPIEDPSWKILTRLTKSLANPGKKPPSGWRSLTAERLEQVCEDPLLGFVVAPENIGFNALSHTQPGMWSGWNLYDCNRARSAARTK
jgi:hypothetical protein